MNKKNMKYSESEISLLTNKFFEATLSSEEEERLLFFAQEFSSNENSYLFITDKNLVTDLRLIAGLQAIRPALLSEMADATPKWLEQRLNSHIDSLASNSRRRKKSILRWVRISAAAVVGSVMIVAGFRVAEFDDIATVPSTVIASKSPDMSSGKPEAVSIPQIVSNSKPLTAQAMLPATIKKHKKNVLPSQPSDSAQIATISATVSQALSAININQEEMEKSTTSALAIVPSIKEEVWEVVPVAISANIDPDHLLLQPMTTLSQSIDNIYESVAVLSEALGGIGSSLEAVNASLASLSDPSLLSM